MRVSPLLSWMRRTGGSTRPPVRNETRSVCVPTPGVIEVKTRISIIDCATVVHCRSMCETRPHSFGRNLFIQLLAHWCSDHFFRFVCEGDCDRTRYSQKIGTIPLTHRFFSTYLARVENLGDGTSLLCAFDPVQFGLSKPGFHTGVLAVQCVVKGCVLERQTTRMCLCDDSTDRGVRTRAEDFRSTILWSGTPHRALTET